MDQHGDRDYIVYCDGGCNPRVGAWSCIVVARDGAERECSGFVFGTTNNQMELSGALAGLLLCPEGSRIRLVSDSQYVIRSLGIWTKGWAARNWMTKDNKPVKNVELMRQLHAAGKRRTAGLTLERRRTDLMVSGLNLVDVLPADVAARALGA